MRWFQEDWLRACVMLFVITVVVLMVIQFFRNQDR